MIPDCLYWYKLLSFTKLIASSNILDQLAGAEGGLVHDGAGVWRLDDLVRSGDDGDVVDATAVGEEHQVTGLVLADGHVLALVVVVLGGGDASNLLVRAMVDGVLRQARAIEADGVGALLDALRLARPAATAPRVWHTHLRAGGGHDRLAIGRHYGGESLDRYNNKFVSR